MCAFAIILGVCYGIGLNSGVKFIKQSDKYKMYTDIKQLTSVVSNRKIIFTENEDILIKTYADLGIEITMRKGGPEDIKKKCLST